MEDDLLLLLALRHAAGTRRRALATQLKSGASPGALKGDPRWAPGQWDWQAAHRQRVALEALDITAIAQPNLPPRFAAAQPPVLLFVRGDPELLWRDAIGIVGSRRASSTARAWAAKQASAAAAAGLLVVSGGAVGIDGTAHQAAVAAGQPTVAYLGVAADRLYPARHRSLFRRMLELGGALVSEHPPGGATHSYDHAERNRFIAAHASRLLIAEAAERSGTLTTARWARRLGTEIWVSPPGVGEQRGGVDRLVADGHARYAPERLDAAAAI